MVILAECSIRRRSWLGLDRSPHPFLQPALSDGLGHVSGIGYNGDGEAGTFQRAEAFEESTELHAVVGAHANATGDPLLVGAAAQEGRPASGAWVGGAGTVGEKHDVSRRHEENFSGNNSAPDRKTRFAPDGKKPGWREAREAHSRE